MTEVLHLLHSPVLTVCLCLTQWVWCVYSFMTFSNFTQNTVKDGTNNSLNTNLITITFLFETWSQHCTQCCILCATPTFKPERGKKPGLDCEEVPGFVSDWVPSSCRYISSTFSEVSCLCHLKIAEPFLLITKSGSFSYEILQIQKPWSIFSFKAVHFYMVPVCYQKTLFIPKGPLTNNCPLGINCLLMAPWATIQQLWLDIAERSTFICDIMCHT